MKELKELLCEGLTEKSSKYIIQFSLKLYCCSSFASRRFSADCSTKGTGHCFFRRALQGSYYERVWLTNFDSTLEGSIKNYFSIVVFFKEELVQNWSLLLLSSVLKKWAPFKVECSKGFVFDFALDASYNKH